MRKPEQSASTGRQTLPEHREVNLERVAEYDVHDRNDEDIGSISAIWADQSGQPAFLGIKTGWLFGKTHVVPAHGAKVNHQDELIRLPYLKEDVKNAPNYDPDTELGIAQEQEVFAYYRTKGPHLPEFEPSRATTGMAAQTRVGEREETTMPLHEEQLKVGKREIETGGVRLRKIVRTETVQQPVELKREEVVVERMPASQRRPGRKAFENEELYIPLRREEPVIEKEARVREEVRARKTTDTERQTISGQVRKEDVEVEKEHHHHRTE